jgi:hypothetical protein
MAISVVLNPTSTIRPYTVDVNIAGAPGGSMLSVYLDSSKKGEARAQRNGILATAIPITSSTSFGNHTITIKNSSKNIVATATLSVTDTIPLPIPTPPGATVTSFPLNGTPAQLLDLIAAKSCDIIEMAAGTYRNWRSCDISTDRTARPLTIRTAGPVVFDCANDGSYGDRAFGLRSGAADITFDGGAGRFTFQHYLIAQDGIFLIDGAHHCTIRGVTVRNAAANARSNGQSSHVIYCSRGSHDLTFEDFDCAKMQPSDEPGATAQLNGLHIYTGGSGAAIYNVTARNWKVANAGWATVVRNATTGLVFDNWQVTDCGHGVPAAMDFGTNNQGTVTNCHTTFTSGTPHIMGVMTDGGGNSWS